MRRDGEPLGDSGETSGDPQAEERRTVDTAEHPTIDPESFGTGDEVASRNGTSSSNGARATEAPGSAEWSGPRSLNPLGDDEPIRAELDDDELEALLGPSTAPPRPAAEPLYPDEAPEERAPADLLVSPYPDAVQPTRSADLRVAPPPTGEIEGDVLVLDEPGRRPPTMPSRLGWMERRRRVKLQARRVRRIVRHVEPWSVLKMSVIFYACLWVVLLLAGVVVWTVADSANVITDLEKQIKDYFVLDTFTLDGDEVFRGYALGGLAFAIAGTAFNVLMCLLFNLISDLVGGVRITMIEEETARPSPRRRVRRQRGGSRPRR